MVRSIAALAGRLAGSHRVAHGRAFTVALVVVCGYAVVRGVVLVRLVPFWQGPDEPGHTEYVLQLARAERVPTHPDHELESAILESMSRNDFYELVGAEAPKGAPRAFAEVERLGWDNTQVGNESPLGYLPHALAAAGLDSRAGHPSWHSSAAYEHVEDWLPWLRVVNVLLVAVTVVAVAWAAAQILEPRLAPSAAALAAAAPMLGFAGAIVNNDLTAAAIAALWFGLLGRTMRCGLTGSRGAALVALALLAGLAKRTALYLLPLLAIVALVAVWQHRRTAHNGRGAQSDEQADSMLTRRGMAAAIGGGLLAATVIALWPLEGRAAGWIRVGRPWGAERRAGAAQAGDYGLHIEDSRVDEWQYLEQRAACGETEGLVARAQLRSDEPGTRAQLVVNDDRGSWLGETVVLSTAWQKVEVRGAIASDAREVRVAIVPGAGTAAGTGMVDADEVELSFRQHAGLAADVERQRPGEAPRAGSEHSTQSTSDSALSNGGAEHPMRLGEYLAERALEYTSAGRLLGALPGGATDPLASLAQGWRGARFLFHSFWGGWGWLTIWPGRAYFRFALLLTGFVVVALGISLLRPRWLTDDPQAAFGLRVCAIAALLAVAISIVGLMAGAPWERMPQGRYLLTVLVPLALPAVALADRLIPRWGPVAVAACALVLDLAGLVLYIWPAYRGLA